MVNRACGKCKEREKEKEKNIKKRQKKPKQYMRHHDVDLKALEINQYLQKNMTDKRTSKRKSEDIYRY